MSNHQQSSPLRDQRRLQVLSSPGFTNWLARHSVSLAVTTYQKGTLFFIGRGERDHLRMTDAPFRRCMGLWADQNSIWMSSQYQIWRFENIMDPGDDQDGFDRLYVPRAAYTTGDLNVHDIVVDTEDRVVFANTRCSCLATLSARHSFKPVWCPPFLSSLAPEDRCHLNGIAIDHGRLRYATAFAQSDSREGWRENRISSGCVIDVTTGRIVTHGLSLPHSPRIYREQLWVLNSGTGYIGTVDTKTCEFAPVVLCGGFLRGLAFTDNYAVVGVSAPRRGRTFEGLPLQRNLSEFGIQPACGLHVIDLRNHEIVEWVRFEGIDELYDVVVLPGVRCPNVIGIDDDLVQKTLSIESS